MTLQELKSEIAAAAIEAVGADKLDLRRLDVSWAADPKFGDLATNAAMITAKAAGRPSRQLAEEMAERLAKRLKDVERVEVAGPGFINMTLSDAVMQELVNAALSFRPSNYAGQVVVAEYSDPSSFKVLHAGHFYTSVVGDAIANLTETAGGMVHRVNFGGDVGLHVAKTMWAILRRLAGEHPEQLNEVPEAQRAEWMSERYVEGNTIYEDDEKARAEILNINKRVYALLEENDHESPLAQIYWTCRQWSYDYFDQFYARIGSYFEKYYPESLTAPVGVKTVREQLAKGVYEESDGAVVFRGEKYGLHTRVFITSQGLPTYEAKDVGLMMMKWQDYHFDASIILTDNSQEQYLAVVLKSVDQFAPKLARATTHLTHGVVKLAGGVKMSSRKGNILRAVDVLDVAAEANRELTGNNNDATVLGAVKYAFLKQRLGGDIIYDPKESVSLEGNSGPYLQYAHARARSILAKAGKPNQGNAVHRHKVGDEQQLESAERQLARAIAQYPSVVQQAVNELMPHYICTYLYELAQEFNRFYEANRVIGDARAATRLNLVKAYADVLADGLRLLGIEAPDRL
jgi:arginyl-tRNA synthetase